MAAVVLAAPRFEVGVVVVRAAVVVAASIPLSAAVVKPMMAQLAVRILRNVALRMIRSSHDNDVIGSSHVPVTCHVTGGAGVSPPFRNQG